MAALAALVLVASADAATTRIDRNGTIVVDGRKVFPLALLRPPPLGSRTPSGANAWDEVARAGANLFAAGPFGVDWTDEEVAAAGRWNSAAAARGIHTWVNLRELARAQPGTPEEARLREVIATLKDDPGLALWKGADEPWLSNWPPSLLAHARAITRAEDPAHLSLLIQGARGSASDLRPYSAVTDLHGPDVYPVRFRLRQPNLHAVGLWTRLFTRITPNRAVLTTLGICFSGSFDPAGTRAFVVPSHAQMRYMAYDAIVNGARGLVFFGGQNPRCQSGRDATLGWNWAYWSTVLRPIVSELGPRSPLYPALLRPGSGPSVRTGNRRTQVVARRVGSEIWVIAAKRGGPPARVTIAGLPGSARTAAVYRENRRVQVSEGRLTDRFGPWAVHVYRLPARGGLTKRSICAVAAPSAPRCRVLGRPVFTNTRPPCVLSAERGARHVDERRSASPPRTEARPRSGGRSGRSAPSRGRARP